MVNISCVASSNKGLCDDDISGLIKKSLDQFDKPIKNVLIIPPDMTRRHSGAGRITEIYYALLSGNCKVDVLPALGTHEPMTQEECSEFFGEVPFTSILTHDWRNDVTSLGQIPAEFVQSISEGRFSGAIDVEINRRIIYGSYDLIISVGQVVPHEVAGMANYSKNIIVGCGGSNTINQTHFLGAVFGMERIMGHQDNPVRSVFDYAEENFLKGIPLMYVLTVATEQNGKAIIHGVFIGRGRTLFDQAAILSRQMNFTYVDRPLNKVVVYLNEMEFKSTWLGNKAIYRTRMAIADGGELVILAPGLKKFGEDDINDQLIRKYGYVGTEKVLALCEQNDDLYENLSVAAHLIHGSTEGRFSVTYAPGKLTKKEIESVSFGYMPYHQALNKYNPTTICDGFNIIGGEQIYFISNPALGLWTTKDRFETQTNQL